MSEDVDPIDFGCGLIVLLIVAVVAWTLIMHLF